MDKIVQTVADHLVNRAISGLNDGYLRKVNVGEMLRRLHQALLKIHASIEEAEGRHIANQHMILQLKMFTEAVSKGHYCLDTFETRSVEEDHCQEEVTNIYSSSSFNPYKRICRISASLKARLLGDADISKLKQMVVVAEAAVADVRDFNILLVSYSRLCRRPYDTYLYLYVDKCMFGRHVEREQTINILLQPDGCSAEALGVLPIVGRQTTGKKTLVENVCNDGRVRNHFSLISFLDDDDLEGEMLEAPSSWRERGVITNKNLQLRRCLFVVEFAFSVEKEAWSKFYQRTCTQLKGTGSNILIVSCLKEAARLCSASPITVELLSPELFWYYFKAIAFGGANPKEHPRLLSLGMSVASNVHAKFVRGNVYASALRANLDIDSWSSIAESAKKTQNGYEVCRPTNRIIGVHTTANSTDASRRSCIFRTSRMDVNRVELPKLTINDLQDPKVAEIPRGEKFEVVLWRSILPPYRIYVATFVNTPSEEKRIRRYYY